MKGKGLVQFFSVALILICTYQLTFNFVTNGIEKRASEWAEAKVLQGKSIDLYKGAEKDSLEKRIHEMRAMYLDSVSGETALNLWIVKFSYEKCKQQQLNLGLDLKGGMNVVMEVSIEDLVKNLAGENATDPVFKMILARADSLAKKDGTVGYITHFENAYNQVGGGKNLASFFANRSNESSVNIKTTNAEVLNFLKNEADNAFDRTYKILKTRIDKTGVSQPNITAQQSTKRIIIELPGVENPTRVKHLLQSTAKLEFWGTYENADENNQPLFYSYLDQINNSLKTRISATDTSKKSIDTASASSAALALKGNSPAGNSTADSLKNKKSNDVAKTTTDSSKLKNINPLFDLLMPNIGKNDKNGYVAISGPVVGYATGKDTARINKMLSEDFALEILPSDARMLWSAKPNDKMDNKFELYAIKVPADGKAPLEGDKVTSARQDYDPEKGKPDIDFTMNSEGTNIWARLTKEYAKHYIAIVLDNYVYSCPHVEGEINSSRSQITGTFEVQEAKDLANILETGKLPAPAKIVAEDVIGPSLGDEAIRAGIRSIIIAFLGILAFMVLYYSSSGWISNFALFFNLFFILGILASRGAVLTLPGIAGLVLTMGMAVDANVLIHERIKEELAKGKNLLKAVNDGHTKSYSAIFDTHLTTLITGLILAFFGLGPVLGYAITLNWGVLMTLFTAVFMAHLVFDWLLKRNKNITFTTPLSKNRFTNMNIQFVSKRKYAYMFSGALAIIGLVSIFTKGFDYGVDFKGGRSYTVQFQKAVSTNDVRNDLTKIYGSAPVVKTLGSDDRIKVTTTYLIDKTDNVSDSLATMKLYEGIQKNLPAGTTYAQFSTGEKYILNKTTVGPSISSDIQWAAVKAIIFSLIGIFLYILLRFRKWQFALGAIIALAHDTLMVMGLFSIFAGIVPFSMEVDETFVAACLTVMGYSVADTVIVFDRIREYLREHPNMDMKKCINDAINNTLSRTIITSSTVLLVLLILFIFGGEVIRGFSFALLIGVGFGTYSSIFVATPIVIDLAGKSFDKKPAAGGAVAKPQPASKD